MFIDLYNFCNNFRQNSQKAIIKKCDNKSNLLRILGRFVLVMYHDISVLSVLKKITRNKFAMSTNVVKECIPTLFLCVISDRVCLICGSLTVHNHKTCNIKMLLNSKNKSWLRFAMTVVG